MSTEPQVANGEKQLMIRRGRVESVDLYEIKDSELDLLERGPPTGIYLNFAIFLLSLAFSGIVVLATATFESRLVENLFLFVSIIGVLGGLLLAILWWRTRASVNEVARKIRERIPPDHAYAVFDVKAEQTGSDTEPQG